MHDFRVGGVGYVARLMKVPEEMADLTYAVVKVRVLHPFAPHPKVVAGVSSMVR